MKAALSCKPALWLGRRAFVLENDLIRLVTLTGGGHIAELRFRGQTGASTVSPLWVPGWNTIEPYRYREKEHSARYGAVATGKTLSGIAGHNICLDYFGGPSEAEARRGLSIHGEAPCLRWRKVSIRVNGDEVSLELGTRLPQARLQFRRRIRLARGESTAYFSETLVNEAGIDHLFHWTEHVTLGPPFLDRRYSRVFISGRRARTSSAGYEGKELLASGRNFIWPQGPGATGKAIDLRSPFTRRGLGFVATVLLNPQRLDQYVGALNTQERLLVGYSFSRHDFPWAAVWEENKARKDAPWNGQAQARGLEFGSTPFPVGRREAFANGPLFGAPHFSIIPARGRRTVRYVAFLAATPAGFRDVDDVRRSKDGMVIKGRGAGNSFAEVRLPALGLSSSD
jgi:hypothetical protein